MNTENQPRSSLKYITPAQESDIPTQSTNGSPVNPGMQAQLKLLSVRLQLVFEPQVSVPARHSPPGGRGGGREGGREGGWVIRQNRDLIINCMTIPNVYCYEYFLTFVLQIPSQKGMKED